jgi:hypothetical protein
MRPSAFNDLMPFRQLMSFGVFSVSSRVRRFLFSENALINLKGFAEMKRKSALQVYITLNCKNAKGKALPLQA